MVRVCCAWYCSSQDRKEFRDPPLNLQFFSFPRKNELLRQKWKVAVSSGRRDNFEVTKNTVICSIHFEPEDFTEPWSTTKSKLRPEAVPTLFYIPNYKEELEMMKNTLGCKIRGSVLGNRLPRRLRKIFVDEKNTINKAGRLCKSFSFFVLPLAFSKGIPWTPKFRDIPARTGDQSGPEIFVRPLDLHPKVLMTEGDSPGPETAVYETPTRSDETTTSQEVDTGAIWPEDTNQIEGEIMSTDIDDPPTSVFDKDSRPDWDDVGADALDVNTMFEASHSVKLEAMEPEVVMETNAEDISASVKFNPKESGNIVNQEIAPELVGESSEQEASTSNQNVEGDDLDEDDGGSGALGGGPSSRRERVHSFWLRLCSTTKAELSYAHEYEDRAIFQMNRKRKYVPTTNLDEFYRTGKQRRLEKESLTYRLQYNLRPLSVVIEKLEDKVREKEASFYKGTGRKEKPVPKRVFFYERPSKAMASEMAANINKGNTKVPMNTVLVKVEPAKVKHLIPVPHHLVPRNVIVNTVSGRTSAAQRERAEKFAKERQFIENRRTLAQTRRLNTVIQHEHNYFNHETYYDEAGRLVLNDPRVNELREKLAEQKRAMKKLERQMKQKEAAWQRKLDRTVESLQTAKRDHAALLDQCLLHPVAKELFLCELKNVALPPNQSCRYSDTVKDFCKTMYKISPRAYQLMRAFFHLPTKAVIRKYTATTSNFISMVDMPPPLLTGGRTKAQQVDGLAHGQPMQLVDLESHDMMYDLEPEAVAGLQATEPEMQELSDDDDYEQSRLENPPVFSSNEDVSTAVAVASITSDGPQMLRRRVSPRKNFGKKKSRADDFSQDLGDSSIVHQQWNHSVVLTQPQQQHQPQSFINQQQQQPQQQNVYNLYSTPQPGTSRSAQQQQQQQQQQQMNQPGPSMPDVYLGADGLKSFDAYYF